MPLTIIAGSDFHYPRRVASTEAVARMAASDADVLILAGDMTDTFDPVGLFELMQAAESFSGPRLYVWGNHELWSKKTPAAKLHDEALPALAREAGFHPLEADGPMVTGGVAFVGVMGWYDYGFRMTSTDDDAEVLDARLADNKLKLERSGRGLGDLTVEDYERKTLTWYEQGRVRSASWSDGKLARWEASDAELTQRAVDRLGEQLEQASSEADAIVAVTHMVPDARGLHEPVGAWRAWIRAYMGSPQLGAVLEEYPKVQNVLFGHCHRGHSFTSSHWQAHNIASPSGDATRIEVAL